MILLILDRTDLFCHALSSGFTVALIGAFGSFTTHALPQKACNAEVTKGCEELMCTSLPEE